MRRNKRIAAAVGLAVLLLLAGVLYLWQLPREIVLGPVTAEAINPEARTESAALEADLVRTRSLFGKGSLRGSVTVDGMPYFSNDVWSGDGTTDDTGWFFRNWGVFSEAHATVEDAVNLTSDGVVTVWLHDGLLELTQVEGGEVSVFRIPIE